MAGQLIPPCRENCTGSRFRKRPRPRLKNRGRGLLPSFLLYACFGVWLLRRGRAARTAALLARHGFHIGVCLALKCGHSGINRAAAARFACHRGLHGARVGRIVSARKCGSGCRIIPGPGPPCAGQTISPAMPEKRKGPFPPRRTCVQRLLFNIISYSPKRRKPTCPPALCAVQKLQTAQPGPNGAAQHGAGRQHNGGSHTRPRPFSARHAPRPLPAPRRRDNARPHRRL